MSNKTKQFINKNMGLISSITFVCPVFLIFSLKNHDFLFVWLFILAFLLDCSILFYKYKKTFT